jgi:iron complex outermembrane receptor protein
MNRVRHHLLFQRAALAVSAICIGSATAQDSSDVAPRSRVNKVLDEIVVTATKRGESLEDIGQAVTALTGAHLNARGIEDLESLQFHIPNFNMGQQLGAARLSLRGVGLDNLSAGAEGSIAFHGDGVFYSRPAAALSTFLDVERVEVLRGPQGTLYGRNASGGSVNIVSRKPTTDLSGYLAATAGNYDTFAAEGALSGPLIENSILGRLAVKTVERGGFGRNVVTGHEIDDTSTRSVRGQLRVVPSESVSVLLRAEYFEAEDNNYGYHFISPYFDDAGVTLPPFGPLLGGVVPDNPRDVANNADPGNERDTLTLSTEIDASWGAMRLTSLTGYQESSFLMQSDLDVSSALLAPLSQSEDASQLSQEFRLLYDAEHWSWLLGAYYFEESLDGYFDVPLSNALFGVDPPHLTEGYFAGGKIDTTAYALFGEVSRSFTDRLRVTLGARYSYEEKRGQDRFRFDLVTPDVPGPGLDVPPVLATPDDDSAAFTPRMLFEFDLGDRLAYASASRGFKSGGINLGGLQPPVKPELVWAYEIGVKADTLDRRLRTHLAGFYYDYTDLQVGQVRNSVLVLENAATATIYGVEAEIIAAPTEHLSFNVVASYLHSGYTDFVTQDQARPGQGNVIDPATGDLAFQLAGNRLLQAPEFSINVGGQCDWTTRFGDVSLRGEVFWVDDIYFTPFNLRSSMQRSHSRQNAFLNWRAPRGDWSGQLFVRNIDNGRDLSNVFVSSSLVGSAIIGSYEEPRTFGARLAYEF